MVTGRSVRVGGRTLPLGAPGMGKKERAKEAKAEKRERKNAAKASRQLNWQIGMGVTAGVIAV